MYLKSILIEVVFTKIEMNNEWNVHFLPNNSFGIPESFVLVKAFKKNSFRYGLKLISFPK